MNKEFKTSDLLACDTCKQEWEVIKSDISRGPCGRLATNPRHTFRLFLCANCMGHFCNGCFEHKRSLCCECVDILAQNQKAS